MYGKKLFTVKISKLSLVLPNFFILPCNFDRRPPHQIIFFTYFRNLLEKFWEISLKCLFFKGQNANKNTKKLSQNKQNSF